MDNHAERWPKGDADACAAVMVIRPSNDADADAIWNVLEPVIRAGETYALPRNWTRAQALAYWHAPVHTVFVVEDAGTIVGTYYLRANQQGGGAHVANCAYVTATHARGRGVGHAMGVDSLQRAAAMGFAAMQFNFVVSTNASAVALWKSLGFSIVGTLPLAFRHPRFGLVDALIMYRMIDPD